MQKPTISVICAIAQNRAIGKNNQLLWHIPEDFKHFKETTSGHPIIMGQRTYESIGRPLPNRTNIIITDDQSYQVEGCVIAHSIEEAIEKASAVDQDEIFFIGGGMIYRQAVPIADKLYLTIVEGEFEADTFFPEYAEFTKIVSERESSDEKHRYKFVELVRE
jgi:dihydrofolate reductase